MVQKRWALSDFGRFNVMMAKRQGRDLVKKAVAKAQKGLSGYLGWIKKFAAHSR